MLDILLFIYFFLIFLIFWVYGGFFIFIWLMAKITPKNKKSFQNFQPQATIIIPTYNEEAVIISKLDNLAKQNYPQDKLQVLVVDSASSDKTVELLKSYNGLKIELIQQDKRMGKAAAINYAVQFAKNDIIVVTDANAYFEPDTLKFLLEYFADSRIGGATGSFLGKNIMDNPESKGAIFYRRYENLLREYESRLDSAICMWGELAAFRKEFLSTDTKNLSEDFDTTLNIRKKGFRVVFEARALVYEYVPDNSREVIVQKRRVILGTIQNIIKYKSMLCNPFYGWFGVLIFPSHKLLAVLSPFLFLAFIFTAISFWQLTGYILAGFLICIFIVGLIIFKSLTLPYKVVKYIWLLNISCFLGWIDFLRGKYTVNWEKTPSSRIIN